MVDRYSSYALQSLEIPSWSKALMTKSCGEWAVPLITGSGFSTQPHISTFVSRTQIVAGIQAYQLHREAEARRLFGGAHHSRVPRGSEVHPLGPRGRWYPKFRKN